MWRCPRPNRITKAWNRVTLWSLWRLLSATGRTGRNGVELTANLFPDIPRINEGEPGAALLREAHRLRSAFEGYRDHLNTVSFTGTDEANTVTATVTGDRRLTALDIEDGLLRLGANAVAQRITEALQNAHATATGAIGAEQEKLLETLGLTAEIMQQFDSALDSLQRPPA